MEIKSLKKAIEEGEVEMLKDKCPKCGKLTLLTDDDTIWCRDEKNCGYIIGSRKPMTFNRGMNAPCLYSSISI